MSAGCPRPRALVIDDDAVMRITIEDCLASAGFDTAEARDGEEGLRLFAAAPSDIVVLDVVMPGLDGFTVCRRIRESAAGAHVPILMLTGRDDVRSVNQAFSAGATDFSTKPVNPELLAHRVKYMLRAKRTADALREREASLAHAQRIARLGNWELDPASRRMWCSDTMVAICGLEGPECDPETLVARVHEADRAVLRAAIDQSLGARQPAAIEYRMPRGEAGTVTLLQHSEVILASDGTPARIVGTVQDISERRVAESRIRELAYYDNVTSLPNRTYLHERLEREIASARRDTSVLGVLFIDLDDFKHVNDTWGHSVGDELLNAVGRRLTGSLRENDLVRRAAANLNGESLTVARLGGDEFVILLAGLGTATDAARVAERVNAALKAPFVVRDTEVYVGGSIGVSVFPDDASDAETLLRNADGAMYEAKAAGRNLHRFYSTAIRDRAFTRLSVEAHMRRGIERGEFDIHYQPKIHLASGRPVGMEALLRWRSAELGTVSPVDFIPVAEATGLIVPLGEWVLDRACARTRRWQDAGLGPLRLSINLSMAQFARENLTRGVADALSRHGLAPADLELELTESLLMTDPTATLATVNSLKELGVALSIDDFGTGFSSLSYLKQLPVDRLKIDRCFVCDMERDQDDAAIVGGTIALAHSLRLAVVAEGVETAGQAALLRALDCDEVQGYHYARPLGSADFEAWMTARRCAAAAGPRDGPVRRAS